MEKNCSKKKEYMDGKIIEPLKLEGNENIKDFVNNVFGDSGYNARRLAEACNILSKMIEDDTTICLTLAGAMTPIGMSGPIIEMMKLGFIDFIISTGANLYHDLHRPFNYPIVQGEAYVDDNDLHKHSISRIYDVFIEDNETLMATDKVILKCVDRLIEEKEPVSTARLHYDIGKTVLKTAPHPEKSMLATAAKLNVPIYTSSPGDSSIAMNLAMPFIFGKKVLIDPILDVIETTAIVRSAKKNGVIEVGGGSPKNFYMQTQPTLWQIFQDNKGGHDYFIQLTTDAPHWGGLSGATPQEAKSWGKIKDATKNNTVVYSCASITFPLLCQYARLNNKPRIQKNLYQKRDEFVKELVDSAKINKDVLESYKNAFGKYPN